MIAVVAVVVALFMNPVAPAAVALPILAAVFLVVLRAVRVMKAVLHLVLKVAVAVPVLLAV